MSYITRYINIIGFRNGSELIPFFDSRIKFNSGKEDELDSV